MRAVARKLIIRRIQLSESTLFQPLLEREAIRAKAAGKKGNRQKAVNLDSRVFVQQLYPGLKPGQRFDVNVAVVGPDSSEVQNVSLVIQKQKKNWRLEGPTIRNPAADPARYNGIAINDYLLLEFVDGTDGYPRAVTMQILTRHFTDAHGLTADLDALFRGKNNLELLPETDLAALCARTRGLTPNPLASFDLQETELIEAAVTGDAIAVRQITRTRNVSRETVTRAQQARDLTGQLGEKMVAIHLAAEHDAGRVKSFSYEAEINALAPFDFSVELDGDGSRFVDVKSTTGEHDTDFHMSWAELLFAAEAEHLYEIYRVSNVRGGSPALRISSDVRPLARELRDFLSGLPAGVRPGSFAIATSLLNWSTPVALRQPEPDDADEEAAGAEPTSPES